MSKLVPFCLTLRSPATLGASTTLSEPPVTFEIGFMLALISVALILFVLELFPIEVTAMLMLATLLAFGIVTVEEGLRRVTPFLKELGRDRPAVNIGGQL